MPSKDEITPSELQAQWLVEHVVLPGVSRYASEIGIPATLAVHFHSQGKDELTIGAQSAYWKIRAIVRASIDRGELRVQLQGRVPPHQPTGFSGFNASGAWSAATEPFSFRAKSDTALYNVTDFREWS
jgi:hypothetical protein